MPAIKYKRYTHQEGEIQTINSLLSVQVIYHYISSGLNKFYSHVIHEKAFRLESFGDLGIIDMGLWSW